MDLRIVKTKKAIREEFLKLRKKQPLDTIRVSDLCRNAMINKTTFYNHYQDIYALETELEGEFLKSFFENFDGRDMLLTDAERFIRGLDHAVMVEHELLDTLFYDQLDVLTKEIETHLQKLYPPKEQMMLSFLIGGAVHLMANPDRDSQMVKNFLAETITKITQ